MASLWLVHKRGESLLTFRDLVALAREGEIEEEDLVRAEWEPDWRAAHTVVGLFYRVRRPESVPASAESVAITASEVEAVESGAHSEPQEVLDTLNADEIDQGAASEPTWAVRLRELAATRMEKSADTGKDVSAASVLIEAALLQADRPRKESRLSRLYSRIRRVGAILWSVEALWLLAGGTVSGLLCQGLTYYARSSAIIFPQTDATHLYMLPIVGSCTRSELVFIEFDIVIVVMGLAWWGSRYFGTSTANRLA